MSSRIERMRQGDRAALRELLEVHGLALHALVLEMTGQDERLERVEEGVRSIWRSSALAKPDIDERAFVLSVVGARLTPVESRPPDDAGVASTDESHLIRLVAKVAAGLGRESDRSRLETTLRDNPGTQERARRLVDAIGAGTRANEGELPGLDQLWSRIEPELR